MKRRSVLIGGLLGVLTGTLVIWLTYLGYQLVNLPFPPFSLFDFVTRVLPGSVITVGIDTMVGLIVRLNVGSLARSAKLAERGIAYLQFILLGGVFGGFLGAFHRLRGSARLPVYGYGFGLLLAAVFVGVEAFLGFRTVGLGSSVAWLALVFGGWGLTLGWLLRGTFRARSESPEAGLSRREVLYLGGTALLATVATAVGVGSLVGARGSEEDPPAALTALSGELASPASSPPRSVLAERIEPAPGTRAEITPSEDFYRIDITTYPPNDIRPPSIGAGDWQLEVGGLVDNPVSLTLEEIRARPSVSQYITLSCISNPIGGELISTALWTGTRLKDLLEEVGVQSEAQTLYIESEDGFYETVVREDMMDERTLLVYEMNGQPLPSRNGFPLRIYIPNRYGMKQPKWIIRIQAVSDERLGYWVERGWSRTALLRTTSAIDNVSMEPSDNSRILMGGIAHAGEQGISKVEIQVDDSPWREAELRVPPLSPLTWVQWRYESSLGPGNHLARARAYDGEGELQVLGESPPHPDGATGTHTFPFGL